MAKILLVEDNEMNRDMLSRRLERKGHSVTIALDGAEGLSKARSDAPDLILMDMSLPTSTVQPRRFESVGVLFCDLVGFTAYCDQHPPEEVLEQTSGAKAGSNSFASNRTLQPAW